MAPRWTILLRLMPSNNRFVSGRCGWSGVLRAFFSAQHLQPNCVKEYLSRNIMSSLIMESKKSRWREKVLFFSLGALFFLTVALLMGAASDLQNTTLNFGRYQLSSWATQLDDDSGAIGAFVIDTVSGETRTVYMRTYGKTGESKVVRNDLKKPFNSIR